MKISEFNLKKKSITFLIIYTILNTFFIIGVVCKYLIKCQVGNSWCTSHLINFKRIYKCH